MLSFWERESLSKYDYIIVGAGIVGCSTAYHLKKKNSKAEICLIERGVFPSGASSKNAGFACFGSLTELVDVVPFISLVRIKNKKPKVPFGELSKLLNLPDWLF